MPSFSVMIGMRVGIPFGQPVALGDLRALVGEQLARHRARDAAPSRGRPRRAARSRSCGPSPTGTPDELITTLRFLTSTVASNAASTEDCSAPRCAAPPIWKVRIVSWVPGSPIDCAAMTPTASPILTDGAARQIAAIALAAHARSRVSQVSTERIGTASMPARSIASTASSSISPPAGEHDLARSAGRGCRPPRCGRGCGRQAAR